jgi:branched-chain amino acid transport system ATP-binding protein
MLTIERLNARDGASHILQGVNLDLVERTTTATLGRNGVGKTTTMRSIMGLVPPTSGCVRLGGIEITGWATHRIARAGIAYVPAGRQIFPDLSVVENIRVVECRPAKIWPISRLLGLFPSLKERSANKGAQLSGGKQQMLAIARALVSDPKVLLLDEPSQGLAPLVVLELADVLRRLRNDDGVTIR